MKILHQEQLAARTTIKIGGVAENFYIPESAQECCKLQEMLRGECFYVLGGGSNVLMDDEKTYRHVVFTGEIDPRIEYLGDGFFYAGAGVRIQQLIQFAKSQGYGGIEYLYSLPALVGGIVCMNAGRGHETGECIAQFVEEVYAVRDGQCVIVPRAECGYEHRRSVFQQKGWLITGVKLRLISQREEVTQRAIVERIEHCRRIQDHSGATFGTVLSKADPRIMRFFYRFSCGTGIRWSRKRMNWMINDGTGTFKQAKRMLTVCQVLHRLMRSAMELEVRIWE